VNKLALAKGSVVFPSTIVACSINPNLLSVAVSETAYPLTQVGCPRFESVKGSLFTPCVGVEFYVSHSLFLLVHCEVATVSLFGLSNQGDLLTSTVSSPKSLQFYYVLQLGFVSCKTDFWIGLKYY
jgi:hypothetical protein